MREQEACHERGCALLKIAQAMIGQLQRIREKFTKKFETLGKPKTPPGCIPNNDLGEILVQAREKYPNLPVWEQIEHPRDNYFSIHALPLLMPPHEGLKASLLDLKNQMIHDGVGTEQSKLQNRYEERFSHLWVAEMQRWTYRTIGIATFTRETGRDSGEAWWLSLVWMNPAQRHHQVLRHTVPYFKKWHPGFVVAREHPIVNRSMKDYPEHLQAAENTSLIWEE